MEDLIPLLIVIAISIISAVGRNKKKRGLGENITQQKPVSDPKDDFLSSIERITNEEVSTPLGYKTLDEEQEEVQPVTVQVEPAPNKYANYSGFISPAETSELVEKEGARVTKGKAFDENDLTKQNFIRDGEAVKKAKFDFDLRKAVIYSEILKRKYI